VRRLADAEGPGSGFVSLTWALTRDHSSGDEGNRTPNPCLAKAVLCQLSYVPGWDTWMGGPLVLRGGPPPRLSGYLAAAPLLPAGAVASRHRSASAFAERLRRTTRKMAPATAASPRSFFTSGLLQAHALYPQSPPPYATQQPPSH
jgi:hypothetical protein